MDRASTQAGGRLKIAMVAACPFPYPRGTPVRIQRLSNALAARGHDVRVFTYHLGERANDDLFEIHRIPNVRTYKKHSPGPALQKLLIIDPLLTAKVFSGLLRDSVDVIHAHHYEGLLVARLAKLGRRIPLVYDAHTLLGSELPHFNLRIPKRSLARLGHSLDASLPRLSDHVVSVTQTIKDKLVGHGMSSETVTVITNGVEYELFDRVALSARRRERPPRLVFTGNLATYQGIENLLRAFAIVVEQRKDTRLLLVTQSSFEPYEGMARELRIREHIEFSSAPFAEHPQLLASAALALNPRIDCDGIPQKLLNYMAAGCATVSFEGSAPCVEHGRTGWTVRNGEIPAFAEGILKLLDEPELADRLGRKAREEIVAHYTWSIAAEKSEAVYRRLIAARTSKREKNLGIDST